MAILVFSPNGTYVTKPTLEAARTSADCVGKTVVVTSALTAAQSDITAAWPTDRALEVKKGGSIANTVAFIINGSFSAGLYQVFTGTGAITLSGNTREDYPEWWGIDGTSDQVQINQAINAFGNSTSIINSGKVVLTGQYVISDKIWLCNKSVELTGLGFGVSKSGVSTYIKWAGAAGGIMIQIQSCRNSIVRRLRLIGDSINKPLAGISMYVNNPGIDISQNSFNIIEDLWIGPYDGLDEPATAGVYEFTNGIYFHGSNTGNNYNTFNNIRLGQCQSGVNISQIMFGANYFYGLYSTGAYIGFATIAPATGTNWFFDNSVAFDIQVAQGAYLKVGEFSSEVSRQLADVKSGKLVISGAFGTQGCGGVVIDATGGDPATVILDDFRLYNSGNKTFTNTAFNFSSTNDGSCKVFAGRNVVGIMPYMVNIATTAGYPLQHNIIDLQLTGSMGLAGVAITGTGGTFTCTATNLYIDLPITISGTYTGTGSITGYTGSNSYYIITTDGTTSFTLSATKGGAPIATTAGTPDLTVMRFLMDASFTIYNNLGPNSAGYAETLAANRYDIPTNMKLKKGLYYGINNLANSAAPTVVNGSMWNTGGTTTITNFANGTTGQVITILSYHAITITNGINIQLAGAVNFVMKSLDTLTLIQVSSDLWRELHRSVN